MRVVQRLVRTLPGWGSQTAGFDGRIVKKVLEA
jgi:hypothetical protein